ncbi:DUF4270 family protein [Chryseobacterium sp. TY4]
MINKLKSLITLGSALVLTLAVVSCESDLDNLGEQLFDGNSAEGVETAYSIIGFNHTYGDVIRTDAGKLGYGTLGAFTEPVFGMQKSSYVSQVRMSTDNADFGKNAVLDSAVLVLNPLYEKDSVTTTTKEDYIYPIGNVEAKKVVSTYPVSKYGKYYIGASRSGFKINVREVNDFLGAYADEKLSNKTVNVSSTVLGSKDFDGNVNSVVITKKTDNTELLNTQVGLRIPLDKSFFQTKIIAKNKQPELTSAANFIRYFKGIQISVEENDGYIFKFDPSSILIKLYYKNDITAADGTVTRSELMQYDLNLGGVNAKFNQIEYDRTGTPYADAIAGITEAGQSQLFAQGMGGSGLTVRIPANTVATLRDLYKNQKTGIVTAKIRLYSDQSIWKNTFSKPSYFTVKEKGATEFLSDMSALANTTYTLIRPYNLDKDDAYYDIGITKTLKDIIEQAKEPKDLIVDLGSYLTSSSTGLMLGVDDTDRAYTPNRIVLKGTDANNIGKEIPANLLKDYKNIQLRVAYSKKNIK